MGKSTHLPMTSKEWLLVNFCNKLSVFPWVVHSAFLAVFQNPLIMPATFIPVSCARTSRWKKLFGDCTWTVVHSDPLHSPVQKGGSGASQPAVPTAPSTAQLQLGIGTGLSTTLGVKINLHRHSHTAPLVQWLESVPLTDPQPLYSHTLCERELTVHQWEASHL